MDVLDQVTAPPSSSSSSSSSLTSSTHLGGTSSTSSSSGGSSGGGGSNEDPPPDTLPPDSHPFCYLQLKSSVLANREDTSEVDWNRLWIGQRFSHAAEPPGE